MIARKSLLILATQLGVTAFGYFGFVLTVRYMEKDAYGIYGFSVALIGAFALLGNLGFQAAHVRHVGSGADEATANATFLWIQGLLAAFFLAALAVAYVVWTSLLRQGFTEATTPFVLVVTVLGFVALSVRAFFDVSFQARSNIAAMQALAALDGVVTAVALPTVTLVWRIGNGLWVPFRPWAEFWADLLDLHGPFTIEHGAVLLAAALFLGRAVSMVLAAALFLGLRYPVGRPSLQMARMYASYAWPVAIVGAMSVLTVNADLLAVGFFRDRVEVADYKVALQMIGPALIVSHAIQSVLFPALSEAAGTGATSRARGLIVTAERYSTMVLAGVMMVAFVFAPEGLRLVAGPQYEGAADILRILAVFVILAGIRVPAQAFLLGFGHVRTLLPIGVATAGLVVLLNILLVPDSIQGIPLAGLHAPGAAWGSVVAFVANYALLKALLRRHLPVPWLPRHLGRHVAAALASGAVLWWLKLAAGEALAARFYHLAMWGLLGLALYLAALVLLRAFGKDEWKFFADIANPSKMRAYIRDSLRFGGKDDRLE